MAYLKNFKERKTYPIVNRLSGTPVAYPVK